MTITATLRQSGGSVILAIPKSLAQALDVAAGTVVQLSVEGRTLSVSRRRRSLAERLAASPQSPDAWQRDDEWLGDGPVGRELL